MGSVATDPRIMIPEVPIIAFGIKRIVAAAQIDLVAMRPDHNVGARRP